MFTLLMQTNTNVSCDVDDDESCDHNNEDRFEEQQQDILIDIMVLFTVYNFTSVWDQRVH
jgi:hypothetical protein